MNTVLLIVAFAVIAAAMLVVAIAHARDLQAQACGPHVLMPGESCDHCDYTETEDPHGQ